MGERETNILSAVKSMGSSKRRHLFVNGSRLQNRHSGKLKDSLIEGIVPGLYRTKDSRENSEPPSLQETSREYTVFDHPGLIKSPLFGLWVFFWYYWGASTVQSLLLNWWNTGYPFGTKILAIMTRDIHLVAATDLVMYFGMYVTFLGQVLVSKGYLDWNRIGWIIQHAWQMIYMSLVIGFIQSYNFSWIARAFLFVHCLTMLMQQYSYACYNAHLYNITKELETCLALYNAGQLSQENAEHQELTERITFCTEELDMQSKTIRYPDNVTLSNFFMFTMFPTLVYQIDYPRTKSIRWIYLFSKILTIFCIILSVALYVEKYIYPIVSKEQDPDSPKFVNCIRILLELSIPCMTIYFLMFYLVWDAIMNSIAELTYFGDREFYRDWWNCLDWDMYARDWNLPVHHFMIRHVYYPSISNLQLSKDQARIFTHCVSALFHEAAMYALFGRLRGYLFVFQMLQIPTGPSYKVKFLRDRPALNNLTFWFGVTLCPSIVAALYLAL